MIESFTHRYTVSKTERFKLIPIGRTEENFNTKLFLEHDKQRAEDYKKVKKYMDEYHRYFIESVLRDFRLAGVSDYAELYFKSTKTDKETKAMEKTEAAMRKSVSDVLKKHPDYKKLFGKEFVTELLPGFLEDDEKKRVLEQFFNFVTYFSDFWKNRENIYTDKEQSTAIAYRCINDNLPKFLDNIRSFNKIYASLPAETMRELNAGFSGAYNTSVEDVFTYDYFSFVLSQTGIDKYNELIGGYSAEGGLKVQGINEYVNLYNQHHEKSERLPLLKPLFKQILSDRESFSFIPEEFVNDDQVLLSLHEFYNGTADINGLDSALDECRKLFEDFRSFDMNGVYITAGIPVTDISNAAFGSWNVVRENFTAGYINDHPPKKGKEDAAYEKADKEFKSIKSFSVADIARYGNDKTDVCEYIMSKSAELIKAVRDSFSVIAGFVSKPYSSEKKLSADDDRIAEIKAFLDSVKDLERFMKYFCGSGKESEKDEGFYGRFMPLRSAVTDVDTLYNKVRNHVTKKPYSNDKIKLNFENPQFLGGWDKNKECDYRSVMLRKDGNYYLAVMDKSNNRVFVNAPEPSGEEPFFEKMDYKLLPDPSKMLPKVFFADSNAGLFDPPEKILAIRKKESFKKGASFDINDCHEFIDFYKASIEKHKDWSKFGFVFSDTDSYSDISGFFREVAEQGYSVKFSRVSENYINEMINNGSLYLFRIYNKDFSEHSKGKPNLHTMYFKMLFDERNLADVVYRLNGQAEMFYREPSIGDEKIVHKANQPIENKNPDNKKRYSTFPYDITKDKRYTERQFALHIPITMNFKSPDKAPMNIDVREELKNSDDIHIIGIDRGERNLLYITVIDGNGRIVEQKSLNEIISDNGYSVDYHKLLDGREQERDKARKDWKTIGGIKELKEGYMSQVIHEICRLVKKYDAVIAMEDLNSGFMNSRKKVEKQVYGKFEKMLTDKLNYLVDKDADVYEPSGLLNALQLTNKADKARKGNQDGIIFYVPAWLTSKIDPSTGFVNLLHAKYESVANSKKFIENIDSISYNADTDMFEFEIDYMKFPRCNADHRKKWTVCTCGDRIETFRNEAKNSQYDNRTVVPTEEYKKLFAEYGIDCTADLKEQILSQTEKDFFVRFMKYFALTLQMRNSITGNTDVDYLISPVRDADGKFYDSREYKNMPDAHLPVDADANGAYNIARKCLMIVDAIRNADDVSAVKISVKNEEWLEFAQSNE